MLIAYMTLKDPVAAMDLYEKALGAKRTMVMDAPDGTIMHAEMELAGQSVMLSCEWPGMSTAPTEGQRSPVNFMLYVENADRAYEQAISAGMTSVEAPTDMFWGDRNAKVADGHGYEWTLAHQVEKVSEQEMAKRAAEFAASMG